MTPDDIVVGSRLAVLADPLFLIPFFGGLGFVALLLRWILDPTPLIPETMEPDQNDPENPPIPLTPRATGASGSRLRTRKARSDRPAA